MGMTIDDCIKALTAKEKCMERETSGIDTECNSHNCIDCSLCYEQGTTGEQKMALLFAVDAMRKYQLMQADYENRLKADMVAILTEIQLEIEENSYPENVYGDEYGIDKIIATDAIYQIIQQKINALKAESEEYVNFADDLIPIMDEAESENNKCPCYNCKHFEKEGWSHCKIHEDAYGNLRCSDYEE